MNEGILHIDMNNFFASVECIDHPEYRDVPMAVAGDSENRHGIILAKNTLAKGFGVVTAEPIWQAMKKCPSLVLAKPHMEKYVEYSKLAKEMYYRYTDRVESFGIDECWLDVRGSEMLFGSGMDIAERIRREVKQELGLTVSIGVSFNKIFAKLGSDYKKPDAITLISRENYRDIVWPLPIKDMLYVGKTTENKLFKYGFKTIGDIARSNSSVLKNILGSAGEMLYKHARGEDDSPVHEIDEQGEVKSIGNSTTLPCDIRSDADVKKTLLSLSETVAARVRRHGFKYTQVQVWIRDCDFSDTQRQTVLEVPANDAYTLYKTAYELYRRENMKKSIRSLGIRAGKLCSDSVDQLSLYSTERDTEKTLKLDKTVDGMRDRYGKNSIVRAFLYDSTK